MAAINLDPSGHDMTCSLKGNHLIWLRLPLLVMEGRVNLAWATNSARSRPHFPPTRNHVWNQRVCIGMLTMGVTHRCNLLINTGNHTDYSYFLFKMESQYQRRYQGTFCCYCLTINHYHNLSLIGNWVTPFDASMLL